MTTKIGIDTTTKISKASKAAFKAWETRRANQAAREEAETASKDEVRKFGQGMTISQYNEARIAQSEKTGKLYPASSVFPEKYKGKTSAEVMTGRRRGGESATEDEVREFGQRMTWYQYNEARIAQSEKTGKLYPSADRFPEFYGGKTFSEVMTGRRLGGEVASEDEVQTQLASDNLTITEHGVTVDIAVLMDPSARKDFERQLESEEAATEQRLSAIKTALTVLKGR